MINCRSIAIFGSYAAEMEATLEWKKKLLQRKRIILDVT